MPSSEVLTGRLRDLLATRLGIVEKRMFGGIAFLLRGNLLVGVWHDSLIARIGIDAYTQALEQPQVREFDVTGRPMKGWVMIDPAGIRTDRQLQRWVEAAYEFVQTLPPK